MSQAIAELRTAVVAVGRAMRPAPPAAALDAGLRVARAGAILLGAAGRWTRRRLP